MDVDELLRIILPPSRTSNFSTAGLRIKFKMILCMYVCGGNSQRILEFLHTVSLINFSNKSMENDFSTTCQLRKWFWFCKHTTPYALSFKSHRVKGTFICLSVYQNWKRCMHISRRVISLEVHSAGCLAIIPRTPIGYEMLLKTGVVG